MNDKISVPKVISNANIRENIDFIKSWNCVIRNYADMDNMELLPALIDNIQLMRYYLQISNYQYNIYIDDYARNVAKEAVTATVNETWFLRIKELRDCSNTKAFKDGWYDYVNKIYDYSEFSKWDKAVLRYERLRSMSVFNLKSVSESMAYILGEAAVRRDIIYDCNMKLYHIKRKESSIRESVYLSNTDILNP